MPYNRLSRLRGCIGMARTVYHLERSLNVILVDIYGAPDILGLAMVSLIALSSFGRGEFAPKGL